MSTRGYESFTQADVNRRAVKLETPKRAKYGSTKTVVDGILFDSKKEAAYYSQLKLRERAGEIQNVQRQPCFPLYVPDIHGQRVLIGKYHADFHFLEGDKVRVVDVKSSATRTEAYRLRKKLVETLYGFTIIEA